jgi:outer membrane receptor protein involved in Fe transport
MTWEATDKLSIDANAQYWSGASFSNDFNGYRTLKNTFVLNAGLNYKLSPKWNVWVKGDNLSDKPYERWADYPSLGVQLKAGIVYSFRQ